MKLNKYVRRIACCLTVVALLGSAAHAQMVERLCRTDYEIDPERQGELLVELDNISFFKDNEFAGSVINGYSLPGLWLQPKGVFYPLKNIKLELGVHALIYSGAYKFPIMLIMILQSGKETSISVVRIFCLISVRNWLCRG